MTPVRLNAKSYFQAATGIPIHCLLYCDIGMAAKSRATSNLNVTTSIPTFASKEFHLLCTRPVLKTPSRPENTMSCGILLLNCCDISARVQTDIPSRSALISDMHDIAPSHWGFSLAMMLVAVSASICAQKER